MTDTRFFSATAIDRPTGRTVTFWSIVPFAAHKKAVDWLRNLK